MKCADPRSSSGWHNDVAYRDEAARGGRTPEAVAPGTLLMVPTQKDAASNLGQLLPVPEATIASVPHSLHASLG